MNFRSVKLILLKTPALVIPLLVLFLFSIVNANDRPFWSEKSAFVEGENLLVVGMASNAKTVEEGRQKAFQQGQLELMNYAQVTNLEAQGLVIETQMTYEEPHPDGTVTVFRLLRVPVDKLLAIQGRIKAEGEAQEQALKQMLAELSAKQKDLGNQTRTVEKTLKEITSLQQSLSVRAKQIEEQHLEVEALLSQLTGKTFRKGSIQSKLEEAEAQLDAREREIARIRQRALSRIKKQTELACKFVTPGMTPKEVRSMLGDPSGETYPYPLNDVNDTWVYGIGKIHFDMQGVVSFVDCR